MPGAEGVPVSATYVEGEWMRPVTAADGLEYYRGPCGSYAEWAAESGVSGPWDETDGRGVANVFRYAFDAAGDTDGVRILGVTFDGEGRAVVRTPPIVHSNGFALCISTADDLGWTVSRDDSQRIDRDGETVVDVLGGGAGTRFFRLMALPEE